MAIRFGGEFELQTGERTASRIEAQAHFLRLLQLYRPDIVDELIALVLTEEVPAELLEVRASEQYLSSCFVMHLVDLRWFSIDLQQVGISNNIRNTPLLRFSEFILSNRAEYKTLLLEAGNEYESRVSTSELPVSQGSFEKWTSEDAIRKLVPAWEELSIRENAKALCDSIVEWSNKHSLTETWILNFVIDVLLRFFSERLRHWIDRWENQQFDKDSFGLPIWKWQSDKTWHDTVLDLRITASRSNYRTAISEEFPTFVFAFSGVRIEETWFVHWKSRAEFRRETTKIFKQMVEYLGSKVERGTKSNFERELGYFLKDAEQSFMSRRPELGKIKRKNSEERHFRWLIEYQTDSSKSYKQIANEYGTDLKSVSEAIKGVAELIGMSVRDSAKAGRKPGSSNAPKSIKHIVRKQKE